MKYFLEMVELARTKRIASPTINSLSEIEEVSDYEQNEFFQYVEMCQPFVFSLRDDEPLELDETLWKGEAKLDAPFKVFSIEVLNGHITVPKKTDKDQIYINCIMSVEFKPKQFMHYAFAEVVDGISSNKTISVGPFFDVLVSKFIDRINSETSGTENVREKIKLGTGNTKRFHTVRRVVHVRPKRHQTSFNVVTNRTIDWSHRWLVRGHWRAISGLGKDRSGNYCVHGNTWVSEHAKGNPELPLINKTRIIGESK